MIKRALFNKIYNRLFDGKIIILIGARQVGKSTLLNALVDGLNDPILSINCDDPESRIILSNPSDAQLQLLVANFKIVIIDEAQRVPDIGITLKRIKENFPDLQLLVSGSSSFDLHNALNEPLTGRKREFQLFPISTKEIFDSYGLIKTNQDLDFRLIYGSYPEIITHKEDAIELLTELSSDYLYKDILSIDKIRNPELLRKLLTALALQIGSEVKYNELALTIGSDSKTIERYIDILEKCYIIFRVSGLSRNLRNELKKAKKIYFYDNGIRNSIIKNFQPSQLRNDMGMLWENFFIAERIKFNNYSRKFVNYYFWRTRTQQEIDFIEEHDGVMDIFEMKWNPAKANTKFPLSFLDAYNVGEKNVVTPQNYLDFLL